MIKDKIDFQNDIKSYFYISFILEKLVENTFEISTFPKHSDQTKRGQTAKTNIADRSTKKSNSPKFDNFELDSFVQWLYFVTSELFIGRSIYHPNLKNILQAVLCKYVSFAINVMFFKCIREKYLIKLFYLTLHLFLLLLYIKNFDWLNQT